MTLGFVYQPKIISLPPTTPQVKTAEINLYNLRLSGCRATVFRTGTEH